MYVISKLLAQRQYNCNSMLLVGVFEIPPVSRWVEFVTSRVSKTMEISLADVISLP